ncbi:MAG: Electron transfer flavoprotein, beta subunit [Candidatus Ozemobacter sibiricus]|jgi:electron transfer flavoprotein beta subunit|uniref:Electron transfer flavoprotein, beta subunit n=1 Tax=Candidatus Ozemobacter sibiricus TaxID=2268124 RepID=A0A367ZWP9_9BACT|nr:MAG: Electron transfer flavoprotein, beta subunit [Candidatus Ozemobacter sibiricus]
MNIIVPIKQVPDTNDVRIDPETGTLIREGVPSIVNPEDRHAVEMALTLKEQNGGGRVIVLSMGPPQAEAALRETLAMGADEAILLSDRAFAGADTLATACALAAAIRKIGAYDLIICGRQAIDGDTAQVGPQLAEFLQIPQATYVQALQRESDGLLRVERAVEGEVQILALPLPALVTCLKEANHPRIPTLKGCISAFREKPYRVWSAADLGVPLEQIGLKGSPTQVRRTFTPPPRGQGTVLTGDPAQTVRALMDTLREKGLV